MPYADHTGRLREAFTHGLPPCKALRADVTSVHRRPARVVTIAIRPSSMGRVAAIHTSFPNFGKGVCVVATRPKEEGRIAIVTNAGRAAVDADCIGAKSFRRAESRERKHRAHDR